MGAPASSASDPLDSTKSKPDREESEDIITSGPASPQGSPYLLPQDVPSMEEFSDKALEDFKQLELQAKQLDSGVAMPDPLHYSFSKAAPNYIIAEVHFGNRKLLLKHKLVGRETSLGRELVSIDEHGNIVYRHRIQKHFREPCFPYTPQSHWQETQNGDRRLIVDFKNKGQEKEMHLILFDSLHMSAIPTYIFTKRQDFEDFQSEVRGKLLKASFEARRIDSASSGTSGLASHEDLKLWEDNENGHFISFYTNRERKSQHVELPLSGFLKEVKLRLDSSAYLIFRPSSSTSPNSILSDRYTSGASLGVSSTSSYKSSSIFSHNPSSISSYNPSSTFSYDPPSSAHGITVEVKFKGMQTLPSFAMSSKYLTINFSNTEERSRFIKTYNELQKVESLTPLYESRIQRSPTRDSISVKEVKGKKVEGSRKMQEREGDTGGCDRKLQDAISSHDVAEVYSLLRYHLPELAATEKYSWLTELTPLGYSVQDIADVLLEKGRNGPWIFGPIDVPKVIPFKENFHMNGCVHNITGAGAMNISDKNNDSRQNPSSTFAKTGLVDSQIREAVQYLCGLGGVRATVGDVVEFGSVTFGTNTSTATVHLEEYKALGEMKTVLDNLEQAVSILQLVGGCCDSFTVLCRQESHIQMVKIELAVIRQWKRLFASPANIKDRLFSLWPLVCPLVGLPELLQQLHSQFQYEPNDGNVILVFSLGTQFLSLAILSYAQAHCGPVRPFFLDTPQERVILRGTDEGLGDLGFESRWTSPCIVGSCMQLTCMGEMIGQPVFAFEYFSQYSDALGGKAESHEKLDLVACAEDLLDTWGPGELITDVKDPERLFAISIGGGFITASKRAKHRKQKNKAQSVEPSELDAEASTASEENLQSLRAQRDAEGDGEGDNHEDIADDSGDDFARRHMQVATEDNKQIKVRVMLDTGTKPNWISYLFLTDKLGKKYNSRLNDKEDIQYTDMNGNNFDPIGKVEIMVYSADFSTEKGSFPCRILSFMVVKRSNFEILLGRETMKKENLLRMPPASQNIKAYPAVLSNPEKSERAVIAQNKEKQNKEGAERDKIRQDAAKAKAKEKKEAKLSNPFTAMLAQTILHWSSEDLSREIPTIGFDRKSKVIIGALVDENLNCETDFQEQIGKAVALLEELGTFPDYWKVSERQMGLGFQGGQYLTGSFQFNQTWVKMPGYTKKAALLLQRAVYTSDLESHFGVQVSFCTGIARRVRLRELLADILPAYITEVVTKPPLWKSLNEDLHIIDALRGPNLTRWLEELDHDHQKTFENLVMAVLLLLQGTGIDRKGQNFIIACAQPNLPFQCFKIPTTRESYWARILSDSEETATFAYITTRCLETDQVVCRGPEATWANSTGLLWTTVSCYQDRSDIAGSSAPSTSWALKHSEAYLLGKPDAPLFVRVDRPNQNEEPRLLVSLSKIPPEYLYRLQMKAKPRRLREKKALDQFAEDVLVLVKQHGKP